LSWAYTCNPRNSEADIRRIDVPGHGMGGGGEVRLYLKDPKYTHKKKG
jgi:hypothetical protein